MQIFLWGFMGVGKTSVGKKLAQHLNVDFIDLDQKIEMEEGQTIAQIFSAKGEAYFREVEHQHLIQIIHSNEAGVISVGGGTPCFADNALRMNATGLTIYFSSTAKELTQRLLPRKVHRPLLKNIPDEDLLPFVTQKLNERMPYYLLAKEKVNADQSKSELLHELIEIIKSKK